MHVSFVVSVQNDRSGKREIMQAIAILSGNSVIPPAARQISKVVLLQWRLRELR